MKIHKEGIGILINATWMMLLLVCVAFYFLGYWGWFLAIPVLVLYALTVHFFRNPERTPQANALDIVAPVDGKVVIIKKVYEKEFLKKDVLQVSIFMSPLNVHVCRFPVFGKIIYKKYHPGKYLVAWHEKSSELNERTTLVTENEQKTQVLFRQIAGFVARRIVFYPQIGDSAEAGREYGFIKFGSRLDIFLPLESQIFVKIGDKTRGGEQVIGRLPQGLI